MPGRKPKPTELKRRAGNPGHRPLNDKEPKPKSVIPTCPKHLNKVAKAEWKRITKELHELGLISSIDRMALAAYCVLWSRWVDAEQHVEKLGAVVKTNAGNAIQNPYLGVANRALDLLHKFASEFGLSPSSRSRLHVEGKPEQSAFEEFLNRANDFTEDEQASIQ